MNNVFVRCICRMMIVFTSAFPFSTYAGMIGTDEVIAATRAQGAREKVRDFIGRSEVRKQLVSLGIEPETAQVRVSAMTDTEAASVAGRIDQLPAGGISAPLHLASRRFHPMGEGLFAPS